MFCLTDNIDICNLCLKLNKDHQLLDKEEINERKNSIKVICSKIKEVNAKASLSISKLKNNLLKIKQ